MLIHLPRNSELITTTFLSIWLMFAFYSSTHHCHLAPQDLLCKSLLTSNYLTRVLYMPKTRGKTTSIKDILLHLIAPYSSENREETALDIESHCPLDNPHISSVK